jgi:hypothetical protein
MVNSQNYAIIMLVMPKNVGNLVMTLTVLVYGTQAQHQPKELVVPEDVW